jgi:hypothetical protein
MRISEVKETFNSIQDLDTSSRNRYLNPKLLLLKKPFYRSHDRVKWILAFD